MKRERQRVESTEVNHECRSQSNEPTRKQSRPHLRGAHHPLPRRRVHEGVPSGAVRPSRPRSGIRGPKRHLQGIHLLLLPPLPYSPFSLHVLFVLVFLICMYITVSGYQPIRTTSKFVHSRRNSSLEVS